MQRIFKKIKVELKKRKIKMKIINGYYDLRQEVVNFLRGYDFSNYKMGSEKAKHNLTIIVLDYFKDFLENKYDFKYGDELTEAMADDFDPTFQKVIKELSIIDEKIYGI